MGKENALPHGHPTSAEHSWGQHGGKEHEVLHASHLEGSQEEEKKCWSRMGRKEFRTHSLDSGLAGECFLLL